MLTVLNLTGRQSNKDYFIIFDNNRNLNFSFGKYRIATPVLKGTSRAGRLVVIIEYKVNN